MSTISVATFLRSSGLLRAAGLFDEAIETLFRWHAHARARRDLALLDDWMLHDIGVTRADVEREWRKPFWRIR
jgi:uncharacterized protein YjiS (DUF1127 family)